MLILVVCVAALVRLSGALEKSTEVMRSMQQLVSVSEVSNTIREMSKEMMKVRYYYNNNNNSCLFYSDHSCLGISGRCTQ